MNRKIFLAVTSLILVSLVVSACGPSQAAIEEAIAQTETARPTATPTSTQTPTPTIEPTETPIPTATPNYKATETSIARAKEKYSDDMKGILEKDYGCVVATWKANSFELACAKAIGYNSTEDLISLAYAITYGGTIRLGNDGLTRFFLPGFDYIVTILSEDANHLVRATTDGRIMMLMYTGKITTRADWEKNATIENLMP